MDIYIIRADDTGIASDGKKRTVLKRLSGIKLIVFRDVGDTCVPEDIEALCSAAAESGIFECPPEEYRLMTGLIRRWARSGETVCIAGTAMEGYYKAEHKKLDEAGILMTYSRSLDAGWNPLARNKKGRAWRKPREKFSGNNEDLADAYGDAVAQQSGGNIAFEQVSAAMEELFSRQSDESHGSSNSEYSSVRNEEKNHERQNQDKEWEERRKKKIEERKVRKVALHERGKSRKTDAKVAETFVDDVSAKALNDAKATLLARYEERFLEHIRKLCYPDVAPMPVSAEDVSSFILLMVRSYKKAFRIEQERVGDCALAEDIDMEKVLDEAGRFFEESWNAVRASSIRMSSKAASVLLPESQYYYRVANLLYGGDKWEKI